MRFPSPAAGDSGNMASLWGSNEVMFKQALSPTGHAGLEVSGESETEEEISQSLNWKHGGLAMAMRG
jgi:hypothetical protein